MIPETKIKTQSSQAAKPYYIRKLAKSGSSRYLSVNTILPKDWEVVKVVVVAAASNEFAIKITPIR